MYFSAKEYHQYLLNNRYERVHINAVVGRALGHDAMPSLYAVRKALPKIKAAIQSRAMELNGATFYKWVRPWTVVPKLSMFQAPLGDFGVGIEVELGFRSLSAAQRVTNHVKNWKYITLDFEGGNIPIEATFPPICYSKLNKKSQVIRYLDYLRANNHLVVAHNPGSIAGTHVNVSIGGLSTQNIANLYRVNELLINLSDELKFRYFGRRPYGYGYQQNTHVEWKLFHSTTDSARLVQYVDIAVALTALAARPQAEITGASVLSTLEEAFNKSLSPRKRGKKFSVQKVQIPLAA